MTSATPTTTTGSHTDTPRLRAPKELLSAPRSTWTWAIVFLLSLSLTGLQFYPALLLVAVILINRFIYDKLDFIVMLTIFVTSPGFISQEVLPVNYIYPLLAVSAAALFFYRKNLMVKRVTLLVFAYILFLFAMSTMSDEALSIQVLTIVRYSSIIFFIIPVWLFANRDFDIHELYRKTLVYFLVICTFYIIDGFILQGWVLLPGTHSEFDTPSVFWAMRWSPFSVYFPRKYPSAMYIVILVAYPLARYFKIKWWQWAIIILAFAATRTMTVIAAFILTYVIFQGVFKQFMKYCLLSIVAITALYFIDEATGDVMRVHSTIEQFVSLNEAQDNEDVADFGTGRMAQILPKYEALVDQGCLWQGFGFIHPEKTTLPRYQIHNDYYSDITKADETAAYVEVTQFNAVLHIGIIGLIVQTIFFIMLYFLIKPSPDAQYYLSAIILASVMGIGGFGGLNQYDSLTYVALALAACLLDARPRSRHALN